MRHLILLFLIVSTLYAKYLPNRVSNSVTGAIGYIHFQKESSTHDDMCIDLSYNISNYIIGLKNSGQYSTTNYIYDSYYIGYYVNNWEFDLGKAIISTPRGTYPSSSQSFSIFSVKYSVFDHIYVNVDLNLMDMKNNMLTIGFTFTDDFQ